MIAYFLLCQNDFWTSNQSQCFKAWCRIKVNCSSFCAHETNLFGQTPGIKIIHVFLFSLSDFRCFLVVVLFFNYYFGFVFSQPTSYRAVQTLDLFEMAS